MPRMPEIGEFVRVKTHYGEREWQVQGSRPCTSCGALIFWCPTGNKKNDGTDAIMPVDAEEDEQGLRAVHWETCPFADRHKRRPASGDKPRGGGS